MNILHHKILGHGSPLVILHGLFGSLDNWMTLGKKFANHHQVILVDQRNHGQSFHDDAFNYEVMAEDLKKLLGQLKIDKCALLGHSLGGKTAMEFATRYPEKVSKLVIADIAPRYYQVHHQSIIKAFYAVPVGKLTSRKEADELLADKIPEFGIRQFLLKNLDRTKNGFAWKMNLDVIASKIEEVGKGLNQNAKVKAPTLFVRGGGSYYIRNDDFNLIHSIFEHSRIETLSGAGHWLHAERPDDFYQVVSEFLHE